MDLGLGTAQFGLSYGVSNTTGQTPYRKALEILEFAAGTSVKVLDTAPAYSSAELILGALGQRLRAFEVVTKTSALHDVSSHSAGNDIVDRLERNFEKSLARLGLTSVDTLLVHHIDDLRRPFGCAVVQRLHDLRSKGYVKKIGVSSYPSDILLDVIKNFDLDVVQLPINPLDQRAIDLGLIEEMKNRKIKIHARSIFLQGLLIMDPKHIPKYFNPIFPLLVEWSELIRERRTSAAKLVFGFLRKIGVDVAIVGVESLEQLKDNLVDFDTEYNCDSLDLSHFKLNDKNFVNPSNWRFNGG